MKKRSANVTHDTKEVQIQGKLVLDGSGKGDVQTGIRFLDHMLDLWAKHGLFDLKLRTNGDVDIDLHHTNEDLGLALGSAFAEALGNKKGIRRVGSAFVPMDETLARVRCVLDMSGRPHLSMEWTAKQVQRSYTKKGVMRPITYDLNDAKHFLQSFANRSGMTVHVDILKAGGDVHHLLEAVFKSFARALRAAVEIDPRVKGIPSTKGKL